MSNRAMTWAFEQPDIPAGAKFVLVALADHASDHAGEDWTCFPSVERLMEFTNQSRATVERHLQTLVASGLVSRQRRKLAGGRLGVYDYVLHREKRAPAEAESAPDHTSNCSMDHASKCGSAMRQNEGSHASNCGMYITPIEPSEEPSQCAGARETGVDWGREVWSVWPEEARKSSSPRLTTQAVEAEITAGADPATLLAAATAYSRDRMAWGASGRPVAPHRFFAEGRWENFAALPPGGVGGLSATARTAFACDDIRQAALAARGESWVASWLDPCGWVEATRTITPGLRTRGERLVAEIGDLLKTMKVRVEGQG